MSTLTRSFTALALLTLAACESNSTSGDEGAFDANMPDQDFDAAASDGPTRDVVDATTPPDKITEGYGVFVSPTGNDTNEGSRARPFATVQAGIKNAAAVGKIVFVCTGSYAEALVVADSISVVGGLDCGDPMSWKPGAALSSIAAPSSPAVRATSITSPTRLEGLAIVAPDATAPSASSIGLLADHSPGLTVAGSSVNAGNGAAGTDGAGAIQLTLGASAAGADEPAYVACGVDGCGIGSPKVQPGGAGGVGQCLGAPNHNGGNGGAGGTGGLWETFYPGRGLPLAWQVLQKNAAFNGGVAGAAGSGASAVPGRDGAVPSDIGSLASESYLAPSGNPGTDGRPGAGGAGGTGGTAGPGNAPNGVPDLPDSRPGQIFGLVYAARGGAGGGAGGCPGLAGSAGTGGGASIGVALIASPIVLDSVAIASGNGGAAGLGSFGSDPTKGGDPGAGVTSSGGGAKPGGNGGGAGVSTNGANGPSFGILSTGAAPTLVNGTKATPGTGAAAINARMHRDQVGVVHTIPATPAGLAADMKSL